MRLANKVAVITGASSGIGKTCARIFAKEGAKVVVVANINVDGGEETVAIIKASGGEAIFIQADVSVAPDVQRLVDETRNKFGKIDILFNNAGIPQPSVAIEDTDESFWDKMYAINVKSMFLTAKYVVPEMKRMEVGVIINTGSGTVNRPRAGSAAYISSKGAVITLTNALAIELAPYNIRVNCINPTLTQTERTKLMPDERKKALISSIPLNRMTKPEDIAYAAVYLASDEATMITGTCINVDGGHGI